MSKYEYELRRTSRKSIAIEVTKEAKIIVRAPFDMKEEDIEDFINKNSEWIDKHIKAMKEKYPKPFRKLTDEEKSIIRDNATEIITKRVQYFSAIMNERYNEIFIKFQKTRFGSCSEKRNLNFNAIVIFMPTYIIDYVVVHEIAHLKQMNHSPAFWREVEKILPDYRERRRWLKSNGAKYIQLI